MNKQDYENNRNEFFEQIKQLPDSSPLYIDKLTELVDLALDYNIKIKYKWNEYNQEWQVKILNNKDKRKILCFAYFGGGNWAYHFEGETSRKYGTALDIIDECFKIYRKVTFA